MVLAFMLHHFEHWSHVLKLWMEYGFIHIGCFADYGFFSSDAVFDKSQHLLALEEI